MTVKHFITDTKHITQYPPKHTKNNFDLLSEGLERNKFVYWKISFLSLGFIDLVPLEKINIVSL